MSAPRAISLVGWSGAGKSTLISRLLPELRGRGVSVAALKHSSEPHALQKAGSDTEAFTKAGAAVVGFATPEGVQLTYPGKPEEQLPALLAALPVDLVLVEGWKEGPLPKIEVWRRALGAPWCASGKPVEAMVTDDEAPPGVPCFTHGELPGLALFILRRALVASKP